MKELKNYTLRAKLRTYLFMWKRLDYGRTGERNRKISLKGEYMKTIVDISKHQKDIKIADLKGMDGVIYLKEKYYGIDCERYSNEKM